MLPAMPVCLEQEASSTPSCAFTMATYNKEEIVAQYGHPSMCPKAVEDLRDLMGFYQIGSDTIIHGAHPDFAAYSDEQSEVPCAKLLPSQVGAWISGQIMGEVLNVSKGIGSNTMVCQKAGAFAGDQFAQPPATMLTDDDIARFAGEKIQAEGGSHQEEVARPPNRQAASPSQLAAIVSKSPPVHRQ
jgi:hypothetical protein